MVLSTHGGRPTWKRLDALFPAEHHEVVSDYLAIEADCGANALAIETAWQIHQRTGQTVWELEVTVPRGLIDANRVLKRALRPVRPSDREEQIAMLVALHQQAQRTILDIVCKPSVSFVVDIHTMAPHSPLKAITPCLENRAEHNRCWRGTSGSHRPMHLITRVDGETVVPEWRYRPVLKERSVLGGAACDEPYSATSDIFCGVLNLHRPTLSIDIPKDLLATVPSIHPTVDLARFPLSMALVKAVSAAIAAGVRGIVGDQGLPMVAAL